MIVMNVYLAEKYLGHPSRITALTALHNRVLISAAEDGRIAARPFGESSEVVMCGHSSAVLGLAAFQETPFIVSASADMRLMIWNVETGECVRTLSGHANAVTAVALADEGRIIVSGGADGALRFWDTLTGALCAGSEWHLGPIRLLRALPHSENVLVGAQKAGSKSLIFQVMNCRSGALVHAFEKTQVDAACAVLLESGQLLIGGADGKVTQWDVSSGRVMSAVETSSDGPVAALASHGEYAVLIKAPRQLVMWDLTAQQAVCVLEDFEQPVSQVMITPDGRRVVAGCIDGSIYIYHAAGV